MKKRKRFWTAMFFVLPGIIGLLVFRIYPIFASFFFSFTEYHITLPPKWIGLTNFKELFHDPLFVKSLQNTFVYFIGLVPVGLIVGILLALLLVRDFKGVSFFRAVMYMPSVVPIYAFAVVALNFFNPYLGLVNGFLAKFGIPGPLWTADDKLVKLTIILIAQWGAGQQAMILMAAMKDIPKEFYESALIDGANKWQTFRKITLPLITPAILYYFITSSILALQFFELPQIMFGGGPNNASLSIAIYLYRHAFRYGNMGYASAMAWFIFLISLGICILYFKTSRKWVFYS
ncbi:MAG TPA: sugar ABC transporter permease [Pseudothermotoga sp.]|nr:sugar ABC transporter permease [Pseudothermotoga sp.]HOK84485.1 sugar ABC transporter permease [Pseudothermotoga sp.]